VRVISRRALREFWETHPLAKEPLVAWFHLMERSSFAELAAVKRTFGAADYVAPYTIFDVGGNKYRLVVVIHYNRQRLYVRHVLTHVEYGRWSDGLRKGKRRDKR
jgi:mRNA interferase HigB